MSQPQIKVFWRGRLITKFCHSHFAKVKTRLVLATMFQRSLQLTITGTSTLNENKPNVEAVSSGKDLVTFLPKGY